MSDPPTQPQSLRQYALLADGERGALVGPRGDVAFLCAPRWHDDAVFSDLLGGRGTYVVQPAEDRFVWGGSYEDASLIWRSRWVTGADVVESREALALPAERDRLVLLRRVEGRRGTVPLRIHLDCRSGFGSEAMRLRRTGPDVWTGRSGDLHVRWTGVPERVEHLRGGAMDGRLEVSTGQRHDLLLEISAHPLDDEPPDPDRLWHLTEDTWSRVVPSLGESVAPRDVTHSWAVLHGLTSTDGGMVAAATTSLPERTDEGRDYDYRFAWIRDQCITGQAIAAAGGGRLLESAVTFVGERLLEHGADLAPAYTVDGAPVPGQRAVDLPGYPGASDVRAGNRVSAQFQLDAFGESLLLFAAADRLDLLDGNGWRAVDAAVDGIARRWPEADAGIWELAPAWWAHSRLACAAGLRAVARRRPDRSAEWISLADTMVTETNSRCLHPDGRWQRAADDPAVDAALLLAAIRGAVPADDPRSIATWRAVIDQLTSDGYVYRFRQQPGPLHEAEGAFVMCGFLLALATHQQGDGYDAIRYFERNRGALGPPGLFTEEFDVVQRQLRGNLPQAFVHALLIETAHTLITDTPGRTHATGF